MPPHRLFFCFKEKSLFWRLPHFFRTPTLKLHAVSIYTLMFLFKQDQGFNRIIYKEFLPLMVTSFFRIWTSQLQSSKKVPAISVADPSCLFVPYPPFQPHHPPTFPNFLTSPTFHLSQLPNLTTPTFPTFTTSPYLPFPPSQPHYPPIYN